MQEAGPSATTNLFHPVDAMFACVKERQIHSFLIILLVLVPTNAIIALPYINPWSIRFGVPAICSLVAMLFFLIGGYRNDEAIRGGSLTSFFRVLVTSTCDMCQRLPDNVEDLHGYDQCRGQHTAGLTVSATETRYLNSSNREMCAPDDPQNSIDNPNPDPPPLPQENKSPRQLLQFSFQELNAATGN